MSKGENLRPIGDDFDADNHSNGESNVKRDGRL